MNTKTEGLGCAAEHDNTACIEDKMREEVLRDVANTILALEKLMLDHKRLVDKYSKTGGTP